MFPFNMGVGGASGVDTGDIGHSLRFRSGATAYLTRTSGSPTDKSKWTLSFWVKRAELSRQQILFGATINASANFSIEFSAANNFQIFFTNTLALVSSEVERDPTAYTHFVISYDSGNATASNRCRVWKNGSEITSWSTDNRASIGTANDAWNTNALLHYIGSSSALYKNDDYKARITFVDGTSVTDATSFGYLNTEINEWVSKSQSAVKAVVDAGGTNSFMLDFDDGTSLTTLGYDKSSKGNNWTLNNFSLTAGTSYDYMLDVPGNSFATLNPTDMYGAFTLSAGNLHSAMASAASGNTRLTLLCKSATYVEYINNATTASNTAFGIGIALTSKQISQCDGVGGQAGVYGFYASNLSWLANGAGANIGSGGTVAAGTIMQIAYDPVAQKMWVGKNNVWYDSSFGTTGDPSTGANPTFSGLSGEFAIYLNNYANNGDLTAGQAPLHASATYHSAAGGYFRYAPPTGFKALCQRNMPDPAILNPENGFVSVIATEDNIYSTLASARSGWADYVDILKNRAAAESWAWQFSHDSSNEYAVSASSLVRQAKRTQSGSNNWVGYSIRIGATYGTAAGSVSHTNGAATTVTHNIGKSARQLILLFNRAGGSAVPVYHPDLTSGELLDLCTTAADAASTAITSVGTNSFQIGSGVATGTYDYLVCSEISQFFDLGKWTGNAAADGAYYNADHKPKMLYAKSLSTTDDHRVYDDLRPGYNVQGGVVLANTNAAETTAAEMDITAFGMKARITTTPNAAQTYVTASWAAVTGKYSLGR